MAAAAHWLSQGISLSSPLVLSPQPDRREKKKNNEEQISLKATFDDLRFQAEEHLHSRKKEQSMPCYRRRPAAGEVMVSSRRGRSSLHLVRHGCGHMVRLQVVQLLCCFVEKKQGAAAAALLLFPSQA